MNQKVSPLSKEQDEELAKLVEKVPAYLRVDSAQLAEIQEEQNKLREKFSKPFAKMGQDEVSLHYAVEYEKMAREFFQAVAEGYPATEEELSFNRRRLAQSLQQQGRHSEAISIFTTLAESVPPGDSGLSKEELALVSEIIEEVVAISIPDEERCSCSSPHLFPTTYIAKHVRVDGYSVPLVCCSVCGHTNVTRQLPEDLLELEKSRK